MSYPSVTSIVENTGDRMTAEQAEFEADLGYLHGLADALFEFGPPRRAGKYAFGLTAEEETLLAAPHDVFMTVAGSVMA